MKTIERLTDDSFFDRSESTQAYGRFERESFLKSVGAAYDLRSRYVHTGAPFAFWVSWNLCNNEVGIGEPVLADRELSGILARAPTYVGLERIIRYSLLRFAQEQGAYVEP